MAATLLPAATAGRTGVYSTVSNPDLPHQLLGQVVVDRNPTIDRYRVRASYWLFKYPAALPMTSFGRTALNSVSR